MFENSKMFEVATRLKLRFDTSVGAVSVEDLWDLPLESKRKGMSLDDLWKTLNKELKEDVNESYVIKTTKTNEVLKYKFEIVKYIIDVKLAEADKARNAAVNKAKREEILALMKRKQDSMNEAKTMEELQEMLNALGE